MSSLLTEIRQCEAELCQLYARLREAFAKEPHGSAHHMACQRFHESYDRLAFPGGLKSGLARLKAAEPEAVEAAIAFLLADPWFHGSGFIKRDLCNALQNLTFLQDQGARINRAVLRVIDRGFRPELRALRRLARQTANEGFLDDLRERCRSQDPGVRRRAEWFLNYLDSSGGPSGR